MRIIKIPKRSGGFRTIYAPDAKESRRFRNKLPRLTKHLVRICGDLPCHGFMPNRSPVTNAQQHVGFQWSLSFDLKDFFDSVTYQHLERRLPGMQVDRLLVDGAARQGLPTSPLLANIAAAPMDRSILAGLAAGVVYTRYADDLTFSSDDRTQLEAIKVWLPAVVTAHKFILNTAKTRLQSAAFGRRVITGVAVDAGLHPTRSVRKKLRAARHQGNHKAARGLEEWCQLKSPGQVSNRQKIRDYHKVLRQLRAG